MECPLILGSCVSRDIYNYYDDSDFSISDYFARTSLISLMSPRPSQEVVVDVAQIPSPFQRRMVEYELTRDFRRRLPSLKFDYMLMDFIDERHDVLEVEPGVYLTLTEELKLTGYLRRNRPAAESIIECGSTRHKILWLRALTRFVKLCEDLQIRDKILVNRTYWATRLATGGDIPGTSLSYTRRHNGVLDWMYHMIEPMLAPEQLLSVPGAKMVSTLNHRWGPSPFHYDDAYYECLKGRLKQFASAAAS